MLLLLLKCTYLSDTVTQNAAGALYTVNKVLAYNTGGDSELATSVIDVHSGESEEEEVMGEGIGEQEMEGLVPE